jgi:hypothetical protein
MEAEFCRWLSPPDLVGPPGRRATAYGSDIDCSFIVMSAKAGIHACETRRLPVDARIRACERIDVLWDVHPAPLDRTRSGRGDLIADVGEATSSKRSVSSLSRPPGTSSWGSRRERVGVRGLHARPLEGPSPSPRLRRGSPPSPASKRGRGTSVRQRSEEIGNDETFQA